MESKCLLPPERSRELDFLSQRWLAGAGSANTAIATGELLDATCCVNKLLLTSEEGMTGGTNTDFDILPGRTRLVDSTTGANDGGIVVFRMKTGFHRTDYYGGESIRWQ